VKQAKSHYQNQVSWWNHDIDVQNQDFPGSIKNVIQNRINRIGAKNQRLTEMVAKTGIKLRKKTDVEEVIPVAVSTRKQVTPILQRETNGGERVVLVPETLDAILHLVDCQGRQFERTPTVFSRLGEEDLRDILLSSLNAVFEGQAVGEAFDVLGKSDIHLRISKGEVFIAECKWWEGPESLKTAHQQLLERLTWHESNGAVIIFCKNTGFSSTLETWKLAIPKLAGARGQMVKKTENQVSQRFCLPGDLGTEVEVRFLIYNLYLPRPSGRSKA